MQISLSLYTFICVHFLRPLESYQKQINFYHFPVLGGFNLFLVCALVITL